MKSVPSFDDAEVVVAEHPNRDGVFLITVTSPCAEKPLLDTKVTFVRKRPDIADDGDFYDVIDVEITWKLQDLRDIVPFAWSQHGRTWRGRVRQGT